MSFCSQILLICECGCGERVANPGNRFVRGHSSRGENNPMFGRTGEKSPTFGRKHTIEELQRAKENQPITIGKSNPFYGKTHTPAELQRQKENQPSTAGENNPMFGRTGENNPMFGKTGENSPRYGKPSPHGKGEWFIDRRGRKMWLRSSWEVIYAKSLDIQTLTWKYEPTAFPVVYVYQGEEKHRTYCPDFYIEEWNKWIEVKGYWRDEAKIKFDAFKKQHPDIKIDVVMGPEIKEIERSLEQ